MKSKAELSEDLSKSLDKIDTKQLVILLCNWFSSQELMEFLQFLDDEGY